MIVMLAAFPLLTTDRTGGPRRFQVSVERESGSAKVYVKVLEDGADPWKIEGFGLTLVEGTDGTLRIDASLCHPSHRGAGIPDALLPELSRRLGTRIVSSSNQDETESRSPEAEKMWKRLAEKGLARYDEQADRYSCP